MSDDLIERLSVDFRMMRTYDDPTGPFVRYQDHAQALTEARAEIERLRAGINGIVNCQGPMTRAQVREACAEILSNKTVGLDNQSPFAEAMLGYKARALAAKSELSTLRTRVREVVGPFAEIVLPWGDIGSGMIDAKSVRAARQLNEDLK